MRDFDKQFFQRSWGNDGYYEFFSYGVGIKFVIEKCINPFYSLEKNALEIGSGGGVFTEVMHGNFNHLTAIDVIAKPDRFNGFEKFTYFELPDMSFDCKPINSNSIDFCFSYNVFCHLSNDALTQYINSVNRVLKSGCDFIFMLANFQHTKRNVEKPEQYSIGDMLPMGHFYQDLRTLDLIIDKSQWVIVDRNMIPEHRDILIHLKKI